mmetsp:Transcript_48410/g.105306  ORF Transcript_48410/g.105306 Transcript_48410/m.105306 type:complete len:291 (+) Transcript_48410:816-1688(+)
MVFVFCIPFAEGMDPGIRTFPPWIGPFDFVAHGLPDRELIDGAPGSGLDGLPGSCISPDSLLLGNLEVDLGLNPSLFGLLPCCLMSHTVGFLLVPRFLGCLCTLRHALGRCFGLLLGLFCGVCPRRLRASLLHRPQVGSLCILRPLAVGFHLALEALPIEFSRIKFLPLLLRNEPRLNLILLHCDRQGLYDPHLSGALSGHLDPALRDLLGRPPGLNQLPHSVYHDCIDILRRATCFLGCVCCSVDHICNGPSCFDGCLTSSSSTGPSAVIWHTTCCPRCISCSLDGLVR